MSQNFLRLFLPWYGSFGFTLASKALSLTVADVFRALGYFTAVARRDSELGTRERGCESESEHLQLAAKDNSISLQIRVLVLKATRIGSVFSRAKPAIQLQR